MRFVNPQKETYHHALIREFSENSRFISSGATKGFVKNRYEWFANFANKFEGNTSFNAHVANVSFFSDHDIFISEYANVEQVTDEYPFLLAVADSILSGNDHEMSTKQYFKVSHPYSAFDTIQFINESRLINVDYSASFADPIVDYHRFYYAPVLYETGYKIDKGDLPTPQTSYDMYLWSNSRYDTELTLFDYGFSVAVATAGSDIYGEPKDDFLNQALDEARRLIDYKIVPTEQKWNFFDGDENQSPFYPFDLKEAEPWSYRPYVGMTMFYRKLTDATMLEWDGYSSPVMPQIVQGDVIERQKIVMQNASDDGRGYFHASGLSQELTDQSQIIYEISKHQIYDTGANGWRIGQELSDGTIVEGIDIDVEANRRCSAIVSTEPYMATRPVHNGMVIDYKLVKADGDDVSAGTFPTYPYLCMKIKAPRKFIASLEAELNKREFNSDIMHMVMWEETFPFSHISSSLSDVYGTFDSLARQEYSTDDLLDGVVGIGKRRKMYAAEATFFPDGADGYTDDEVKICGMGYYVKTELDASPKHYIKAYCNNYVPQGPIANVDNIISTTGDVTAEEGELFRPMLKLSGVKGFVKIIRRSPAHKPVHLSDGNVEAIYELEWPYCPGSYLSRASADTAYQKTQIFYKSSYINAGSWEEDSNGKIDAYNARYVPEGDDSFSRIDTLETYEVYGSTVESDPESLGGRVGSEILSRPSKRLVYPSNLVYRKVSPRMLMLTKPRATVSGLEPYSRFGTFEIGYYTSGPELSGNAKFVWAVDNRVWKYGEDKYSSYINRECPSYVLELDASALSDEIGKGQYKYAGIPDIKRWIYSKIVAFCGTTVYPDTLQADAYTDGSIDVPTQESKSDVVAEVWDSAYPIGSSTRAMWRPLTTSLFDTEKSDFSLLLEGGHVESYSLLYTTRAASGDDPGEGLYSVVVGKFDSSVFDEGLVPSEVLSLDQKDNLVMMDTDYSAAYHIAYITKDDSDADSVKVIAYALLPLNVIFDPPTYGVTPETWVGPISISSPYTKVSRSTDFSFNSCKVVDTDIQTRYMDFGDKDATDGDFARYVDENGKIYIRIRALKGRQYPQAYTEVIGDSDTMQWIEERVTSPFANTNMPWYDITVPEFEALFDWSKVNIRETVRKFGLNYFSLQSK